MIRRAAGLPLTWRRSPAPCGVEFPRAIGGDVGGILGVGRCARGWHHLRAPLPQRHSLDLHVAADVPPLTGDHTSEEHWNQPEHSFTDHRTPPRPAALLLVLV